MKTPRTSRHWILTHDTPNRSPPLRSAQRWPAPKCVPAAGPANRPCAAHSRRSYPSPARTGAQKGRRSSIYQRQRVARHRDTARPAAAPPSRRPPSTGTHPWSSSLVCSSRSRYRHRTFRLPARAAARETTPRPSQAIGRSLRQPCRRAERLPHIIRQAVSARRPIAIRVSEPAGSGEQRFDRRFVRERPQIGRGAVGGD